MHDSMRLATTEGDLLTASREDDGSAVLCVHVDEGHQEFVELTPQEADWLGRWLLGKRRLAAMSNSRIPSVQQMVSATTTRESVSQTPGP